MPRERKQRGHRHAEKRKAEREEEEKKYLESQERDVLFYDRPKNPFGLLTREDEKFFFEVYEEFKKDQWDDEDAKETFMKNVFMEMRGKELKVATSKVGKFLEILLAQSPRSEIQRIMTVFKGHVRELARHRFGSYALEKIAGHVGIWISKDIEGTSVEETQEEQLESLEKLFVDIVQVWIFMCYANGKEILYPEMHEQFTDPFASHVYHAFLYTLNGHPQKNLIDQWTTKKRKAEQTDAVTRTPSSFADLQTKLLNIVKQWDQTLLRNLAFDKYAVPLLQSIIESDVPKKMKKKSKGNRIGDHTIADLLLFGQSSESDSKGSCKCYLANNQNSRTLYIDCFVIRLAVEYSNPYCGLHPTRQSISFSICISKDVIFLILQWIHQQISLFSESLDD